jgi:hypothetical protein
MQFERSLQIRVNFLMDGESAEREPYQVMKLRFLSFSIGMTDGSNQMNVGSGLYQVKRKGPIFRE